MLPRRLPLLTCSLVFCGAALAATGGPDTFGHTWIDSNEPMGPVFMAVDITATGMLVGSGDDVGFPVTLGAPFDFYGMTFMTLEMTSNGAISTMTGSGGDLSNDCPLPAAPSTGAGGRIYVNHDDLDEEAGIGQMFYEYFAACPRPADRGPNVGCSVFMWDEISHFPGGGGAATWDQWAILYDSGDIVMQFGAGNPEMGSASTTGIMDPTFADGLDAMCNQAGSAPDDHAILFMVPNFGPTCALTPPMGTVGGDVSIDITPMAVAAMALDSVTFEYSTDAGMTFLPATAAAASPLSNPALMVPSAMMDTFIWDSVADGVGTTGVAMGTLFRASLVEGMTMGSCEVMIDVDNQPSCTATGPATGSGGVPIDVMTMSPVGSPTLDHVYEYSTDAGMTFTSCTPAMSSMLSNPAVSVPVGSSQFVWDSRADMVGLMAVVPAVLVRVSIDDGTLIVPNTCVTGAIDIDNQSLCGTICGDCDGNGAGPDILDALTAAQIAAGLIMPSMTQMGCCDVDSSMSIAVLDALVMAQAAAGLPATLTCP